MGVVIIGLMLACMGVTIVTAITFFVLGMVRVHSSERQRPPKWWAKYIGWTTGLLFCSGATVYLLPGHGGVQATMSSIIILHAVPLTIGVVVTVIGIAIVKREAVSASTATVIHRFGIGGLAAAILTPVFAVAWDYGEAMGWGKLDFAREALGKVLPSREQPRDARPTRIRRLILVPPDSEWKWLHPTNGIDPAAQWPDFHQNFFMMTGFNDSAWTTGRDSLGPSGGFGYGEDQFEGVDIGQPENEAHRHTAYFRCRFTTTEDVTNLKLHGQIDDGIIVYLDGEEVKRNNVDEGPDAYLLPATIAISRSAESIIRSYRIPGTLPAGEHLLAISLHNISLHNPASTSSDLRIAGITLVGTAPKPD